MDFNPIKKSNIEPTSSAVIVSPETELVTEQPKKEVLSMMSLLKITDYHIREGVKWGEEGRAVNDMLSASKHLFSIKEQIEYGKLCLKAEEYHSDCVFKAYAIMQKQSEAKELWVGSKKEVVKNVTQRREITEFVSLFRNPHNFQGV